MSTDRTEQHAVSHLQRSQRAAGWRQTILDRVGTFVIVLGLLGVASWIAGGAKLMTRQLWMDEVHSWLLLTDESHARTVAALADGADFNPPAWFLVTRWLAGTPAQASEFQIRLLCLGWTLSTIAGLTILLSRHFERMAVIGAVVLTMTQPLLIHHATEIRFYGFWTTCCVWICVVLQLQPGWFPLKVVRAAALIFLGIVVCTTHYFGVFSIGLILLPVVIRRVSGWRIEFASLTTGAVVGVGCSLYFLPGQKAALTRPTWVSPATVKDTIGFLQSLVPAWQIVLCSIVVFASFRGWQHLRSLRSSKDGATNGLWCLLALGGMPVAVVAIAWLLQPALVTRYAVAGLPAFSIVAAWSLHQCGRRTVVALTAVAIVGFAASVNHRAREWQAEEAERLRLVKQIEGCGDDSLVVFEDRIVWMPLVHHFPRLAQRCRLIDFDDSELLRDSSLRIVQRDAGRRIRKWYPQYQMTPLSELSDDSLHYVVPYSGEDLSHLSYAQTHESKRHTDLMYARTQIEAGNQGKHGLTENRKENF